MAKPIYEQLRERYPAPEFAIFFEVANGPGATLRRYADALAMSLFPSRGLDLHGFEVKRARQDWLNELKKPEKADAIGSYCDFWWIVAGDDQVAKKDEVPKNWGLLVSNGEKLRLVKQAVRLDPKPLDRKLIAAILRRAHEWTEAELANDERMAAARDKGYQAGLEEHDWKTKRELEELKELKARVDKFRETSGINIDDRWSYGDVGAAVKAFMDSSRRDNTEEMEKVANWIENTAKGLRSRADLLRKARAQNGSESGGRSLTP